MTFRGVSIARPCLFLLVLSVGGLSCSDKDRRMSEFEALNYRRGLVRTNHTQLSPQHRRDLMYHPGRTQREIDRTFDTYREQFAEQQVRDAATALESRRNAGNQLERLRGFPTSPVDGGSGDSGENGVRGARGRDPGASGLPASPPGGSLGEPSDGSSSGGGTVTGEVEGKR